MNDLQILSGADRGRIFWSLQIIPIVLITFDSTLQRSSLRFSSYQAAFLKIFGNLF